MRVRLPRILLKLVVFQAGFAFILISRAYALSSATGSVITTSPVAVNLSTAPGSSISTVLQAQNNSATPVTINVKLDEFRADGLTGKAQIYTPPANDPSKNWVHFSENSFVAQPGVWNKVTMTIDVPKTAAYGYYYSALFAPVLSSNSNLSEADKVKSANAILVLLDAHVPNEVTKLSVQSFNVDKATYQYLPVNFSINVHNSGQIYTAPSGDIYISRTANGKTLDTLDFNSGIGNVLPGTNRVFTASWTNGFPVYQVKRVNGQIVSNKNGQPVQELKWNLSNITNFRYGKYYAHLVLVYNNGTRDIAVNGLVSFWVIPWLFIATMIVILVIIGFGLYSIVRMIMRRVNKKRKKH